MASTRIVLQRSRPLVRNMVHCSARSNSHRSWNRTRRRASATATSRSAVRRPPRISGEWSSSACRMRSTRASGSSGAVPQTSHPISHSFGPRAPCRPKNWSKAATKLDAAASARSRAFRSARPASKCVPSPLSERTSRPRSQRSAAGSAESTAPSPPSRDMGSGARDRRRAVPWCPVTWRRTLRPIPVPPVMARWTAKIRLIIASMPVAVSNSWSSEDSSSGGSPSRHVAISTTASSSSGRLVAPRILQP